MRENLFRGKRKDNGEFVRDIDIYNMIEPYCKRVNIDIVPVEVQKLAKAKVLEYIDPINLT